MVKNREFINKAVNIATDIEQKMTQNDDKNVSKVEQSINLSPGGKRLKGWDEVSDWTKRRRKKIIKDAELKNIIKFSKENDGTKVTNEDALHLLYGGPNGGFSKQEYTFIRETIKVSYPSYLSTTHYRDKILPQFSSDENTFSVTLQDNHDNNSVRLLQGLQEYDPAVLDQCNDGDTLIFHHKVGADGSGSMGSYNVRETRSGLIQDSSIYNVALTPVSLRTEDGKILWLNPVPNSPYLTRPIFCGFVKETHDIIIEHFYNVQAQQANLEAKDVSIDGGKKIRVKPLISTTMFDGKSTVEISKKLTGKAISYLTCHICGCRGSDFNKPIIYRSNNDLDPALLDLGPSSLHCTMRSMEGLFNLGVRAKIGPNLPMSSPEFISVKESFKSAFKERLNLKLYAVHPIHGSSNDGNAARDFFANEHITADILGLPVELISGFRDLNNILSNTKQHYDLVDFEIKARRIFKILTESPEFEGLNTMSPTMHRIIVHGAAFIKHFQNKTRDPIGALSESALESRNKHTRSFRKDHSWRGSLKQSIKDIGIRLLVTSDIYLFMKRKIKAE